MKVHFKYPRRIESKLYNKGTHTASKDIANHWFFKALVKCGDIEILSTPSVSSEPDGCIPRASDTEEETVSDVAPVPVKRKRKGK